MKDCRKVTVGPFTFLFENHETIQYQVLELIREGGICREEDLIREMEDSLLFPPEEYHLRATLHIEFKSPLIRTVMLRELRNLNRHIHIQISDHPVQALYDEKVTRSGAVSSIQHLTFPLGKESLEKLFRSDGVYLHVTHPSCRHSTPLPGALLTSLEEDLARWGESSWFYEPLQE